MKNLILVILSVICAVNCNQLIVLSSPKSVEFKGQSELPAESLSDVLAATLGYSIDGSQNFDGLFMTDPFSTAKSVVSVVVEGIDSLNFQKSKSFNIAGDELSFEDALHNKVAEHSHLAIDVDLIDKIGDEVKTPFGYLEKAEVGKVSFLKPKTNKYDEEFLNQVAYLKGLTSMLTEQKEKPTALNVRVSLKGLSAAKHSETSPAFVEATKILSDAIEKLNAVTEKVYNSNGLFVVVTVVEHQRIRSKRQAQPEDPNADNPYNLAELTSADYPVVFNIIFWFTVVFIFSLLAISLALSNVEDKDSIIYRMTGARGKKDN